MKISIFVTIWLASVDSVDLSNHFLDKPLAFLKSNQHVSAVEFYIPETGEVPRMDDIPAPSLIVEINLNSEEQAKALISDENFLQLFTNKTGILSDAEKINLEVLEAVHFDIPGYETPPVRTAPFSFVVRYYGPVRNTGEFVDFYVKNHPPLLAKFPRIRNVLCYLPLGWRDMGELTDESILIGNEVVFDNLEDFNVAMGSPVLEEVMADADLFKPYGYSSHHGMQRERVYQRDSD